MVEPRSLLGSTMVSQDILVPCYIKRPGVQHMNVESEGPASATHLSRDEILDWRQDKQCRLFASEQLHTKE